MREQRYRLRSSTGLCQYQLLTSAIETSAARWAEEQDQDGAQYRVESEHTQPCNDEGARIHEITVPAGERSGSHTCDWEHVVAGGSWRGCDTDSRFTHTPARPSGKGPYW